MGPDPTAKTVRCRFLRLPMGVGVGVETMEGAPISMAEAEFFPREGEMEVLYIEDPRDYFSYFLAEIYEFREHMGLYVKEDVDEFNLYVEILE